jgi:hypothetical protein
MTGFKTRLAKSGFEIFFFWPTGWTPASSLAYGVYFTPIDDLINIIIIIRFEIANFLGNEWLLFWN